MSTIKPLIYDAANARLAEQTVVIPPGYIDGLNLVWNSGTSISVTSGSAYIEGAAAVVNVPAELTLSGLSLTASTWYHVYLYLNAGVPAIECVTSAPATAYSGTARSKTGDTSRRYLGSVLTTSANTIANFVHSCGVINYLERTDVAPFRALNAGVATAPTAVSLLACGVPVTARTAKLNITNLATDQTIRLSNSESSVTNMQGIRPLSGFPVLFPTNSSQQVTYFFAVTPAAGGAYIDVIGYGLER